MSSDAYTGKIVSYSDGYYKVEAPDAPQHLRVMFLRGSEITPALDVGMTGTLVYRTASRSGLWYLTES